VNASKRGRPPSPEKRQAILDAVQRLFAAKGVDATTTREIAAEAQTTERTLFKHFVSKEGLVRAAIEQVSFTAMQQAAYARILDPQPFTASAFADWHRAFLADRVRTAIAAPDTYAVLFRELFRDGAFRADYAERWLGTVFGPLCAQIERMQKEGAITSTQSPDALTSAFFSLSIGYLVSRFVLMPDFLWDDEANIDSIVAMFQAVCCGA
jgi:AcrR family transcriptional regulator